jgi:Trehalase
MHWKALAVRVSILFACSCWSVDPGAQVIDHPAYRDGNLRPILDYIASGWATLTRSTATCEGIADIKVTEPAVLYLPADLPVPEGLKDNPQACGSVRHLPFVLNRLGQVKGNGIQPPGLLYLEKPYVVPGGRFNEMYGWDSYFIVRGLIRSGNIDLARNMVENFFFEIGHYGGVLNANRTYYLTRSQPPFLSSMIVAVYDADKACGKEDRSWLRKAYHYAEQDYEMWIHDPHLAGNTGLSRYYDLGDGRGTGGQSRTAYMDALGRLIKKITPEGGTWTYYYDSFTTASRPTGYKGTSGLLGAVKDPNGNLLCYAYVIRASRRTNLKCPARHAVRTGVVCIAVIIRPRSDIDGQGKTSRIESCARNAGFDRRAFRDAIDAAFAVKTVVNRIEARIGKLNRCQR